MATFSDIIASCRVLLNDSDPDSYRYTTPQLLEYAVEAVHAARKVRPDFFLGQYSKPVPAYVEASVVPIPETYHSFIKDYVVGRAELRDDEFTNDGRAVVLLTSFKNGMLGL